MADRLYRTQILLAPEQHKALSEIAHREGRSISELVRAMIQQELEQRNSSHQETKQRRLAALERIRQHREEIIAENGGKYLDFDVIEAIRQAREEQDGWLIAESTESGG